MGYKERNLLVINDLIKLLNYKKSNRLKEKIYSYLFVFMRYSNIDIDIPENIPLDKSLSVKDSNERIISYLRITPKQVEKLGLETLRPDSNRRRQQRYKQQHLGTSSYSQYREQLAIRRQELYRFYLEQKSLGISTTKIAKQLGISRSRLYQIIHSEQEEID